MSMIRATSNPEGLYIYHSVDDIVVVMHKGETLNIPPDGFYYVMDRYCGYSDDPLEAGGVRLDSVYVYEDNNEIVPEKYQGVPGMLEDKSGRSKTSKVRLQYNGHSVFMYQVTFDYIQQNAQRRT